MDSRPIELATGFDNRAGRQLRDLANTRVVGPVDEGPAAREGQLFGQNVMLHGERPRVLDYQSPHLDYAEKRDSWWCQSTRYFVDCIASGLHPTPDVEDGLRCLRVLRAMDESVRTGKPVAVAGQQ
jgi:predicted dehydrogenase